MEIKKTNCIILHKLPVREADVITVAYTENYGKQEFIFRGIQKTKRRSLVGIEPGSIINVVFYYNEHKSIFNVKEFSLLYDTVILRDNLKKMMTLLVMLEVIDKTTGTNDPNVMIYKLLKGAICTLPKTDFTQQLLLAFLLHYLKLSGILPDIFHCTSCKIPLESDMYLHDHSLQPFCFQCTPSTANRFENIVPFIKLLMKEKFLSIQSENLTCYKDIEKFLFHVLLFIDAYFQIHIKSKNMLFVSP